MLAATEQSGTDLLQIAQEIGEKLLRNPEALRALCLGVRRMQQNIYPGIIKLEVPANR
jgi:hypothetical protein